MSDLNDSISLAVQPKVEPIAETDFEKKRRRRRIIVNVVRLLILVVLLSSWEVLSYAEVGARYTVTPNYGLSGNWRLQTSFKARRGHIIVDPFFFGRPSGIVEQLKTWIVEGTAQGTLWEQIFVTLEETFLGFVIGAVLGIIGGILLGRIRLLADILAPYINIANAIPRVVLGPLFIVSLGLGLQSKVALAVVMVFFAVFFNAFQGVREVDRNLLANARLLGANSWQVSTQVVLPSAMTWIIASLHISFGLALVGSVVSEFLGALKGLGLLISNAMGNFAPNQLFAAIFILALVALAVEWVVTQLEHRLIVWRPNPVYDVAL